MDILVRKISKLGLLKIELAVGTLIMLAAVVVPPIGIFSMDATLLANPYVLGFMVVVMLSFASVGFFGYVRPYFLYRRLPEVQVESDGEYLYIHSKKEAKIPLSALGDATVDVELPYLFQSKSIGWFIRQFIVHMGTEEYGNIVLEIPEYGKYKLYFVAYANDTANELSRYIYYGVNN